MADVEVVDHAWLVDMVLQFMSSPNWAEPIEQFITEHCTAFDNFQEENKHEFFEVHTEYKNLVDTLLTAHLLEVDIDPAEFEKKVVEAGLKDDPRLQMVVTKLAAADDFLAFKEMMVARHQSLQCLAEQGFEEMSAAEEEARRAAEAVAFAEAEAVAAAADAAERAAAKAPAPAAAPKAVTPGTAPKAPSAAEERAFGAGGGAYGRAQMAGGAKKAGGNNEKAAAIRSAILGAARK